MLKRLTGLVCLVALAAVICGCSADSAAVAQSYIKVAQENGLEYRLKISGPTEARGVMINGFEGGTKGWIEAELVSKGFVPQGSQPEDK